MRTVSQRLALCAAVHYDACFLAILLLPLLLLLTAITIRTCIRTHIRVLFVLIRVGVFM